MVGSKCRDFKNHEVSNVNAPHIYNVGHTSVLSSSLPNNTARTNMLVLVTSKYMYDVYICASIQYTSRYDWMQTMHVCTIYYVIIWNKITLYSMTQIWGIVHTACIVWVIWIFNLMEYMEVSMRHCKSWSQRRCIQKNTNSDSFVYSHKLCTWQIHTPTHKERHQMQVVII